MDWIFAIPLKNGKLSEQFRHAEEFCIIYTRNNNFTGITRYKNPDKDAVKIADWLLDLDITHVLAAGMSKSAIEFLSENDVDVTWKLPTDTAEFLVKTYLENHLIHGKNVDLLKNEKVEPEP